MTSLASATSAEAPAEQSGSVETPQLSVSIPGSERAYRHHIVPHTHWDREWYMPHEHFQIRLAQTLDEVLRVHREDPEYGFFTLDGQAIVLEDYLEMRPGAERLVREGLSEGKLVAGPFYVLPDPLVGQESLVRNLIIGRQVVERFGGRPMDVWYEPDTFGHIAQLPQLARECGMRSAILWRGLGDEADTLGAVFRWRGPDGSEVYAIRQLDGYGNACNLGRWSHRGGDMTASPEVWEEVALDRVEEFLERYGSQYGISGVRDVLWCNGTDHMRIQPELTRIVRSCNSRLGGSAAHESFEITTYDRYVLEIEENIDPAALKLYEGEMFGAREVAVLRGVNSTRMYLKQRYEAVERAIIEAETLSALALFERGNGDFRYPADEILLAWKRLLHNAPHDSICGCSVDEVHCSMLGRYEAAERLAARIRRSAMSALGHGEAFYSYRERAEQTRMLANVLPWRRTREVAIPVPLALKGQGPLVVRVSRRGGEEETVALQATGDTATGVLTLRGFEAIAVTLETGSEATPGVFSPAETTIENEYYQVQAGSDGTVSVLDKRSGKVHAGLHYFEDCADRGDEYNFCPLDGEEARDTRRTQAHLTVIHTGPVFATLRISWPDFALPASLTEGRDARLDEHVPCLITSEVTLYAGVDRVDFRTTVDNRAMDHRLRVVFPTSEPFEKVRSEGHFAVIERPARPAEPCSEWQEEPSPTHQTLGAVAANDLLVMTKGLPEYEAVRSGSSKERPPAEAMGLAITLLRCVGWLSREDLSTRRGGAGPGLATPEAQCLGVHVFEYAIAFRGEESDWQVVRRSQDYRYVFSLGPAPVQVPQKRLSIGGEAFAFSALKGAEDGRGPVLRVFNPGNDPGCISLGGDVMGAARCRIDEQDYPGEEPVPASEYQIDKYRILTLRLGE